MAKKIAASLTAAAALVLPMLLGCTMPFSDPVESTRSGGSQAGGYNQAPGGAEWPRMGYSSTDARQAKGGTAAPSLQPDMPQYGRDNNPFDSDPLSGRWMRGERYPDMDPANPIQKGQMGMHVDRDMVENRYNPNTLAGRVHNSDITTGLTQNTFAPSGGDHNVTLDPSGKTMYFCTTRISKNPKLAMQDVDNLAWTLLTDDSMADMMPAVSPNGRWLAWCSNRYGNWSLLLRPLDAPSGSSPEQLTRTQDDDIHPSWSPDSQFLAYSRYNSMDGQWQI